MVMLVMKIIKEELQFEESLKQRLEFICEFSKKDINEILYKIKPILINKNNI